MSTELKLSAETGRTYGSSAARRLRREDKIPAVIYGHGSDPIPITLERPLFRAALNAAGPNAIITLDVDGAEHLTIVKDMQRDSIANRVTHVDFQLIRLDELLVVDVPVVLVGEAVLAEREGAVIQQQLMSLTVEAPAGDIPATFEVDISDVDIDNSVRVGEMSLGANVVSQLEDDTLVVVAQRSRASIAAEGDEVGEDGELIEDAEGAEGDGGEADDSAED